MSLVVVMPKKNEKWHVCVDYKPLNPATKRDRFPLSFEDEILNAYTSGIRVGLYNFSIAMCFGSMLVPILVTLFYFSTSTSRRQPIFVLNVLSRIDVVKTRT